MPQQISKKILIYFFLFILLGTVKNLYLDNLNFPKIKKIDIIGLEGEQKILVLEKLNFLKLNNIFFFNNVKINNLVTSNNIVEKYSIFKKYPSTLEIKINKTKILANTYKDGLNYQIGSNGKFIKTNKINKNIPFVFGDFKNIEFLRLKEIIENLNFNYKNIKNFYYFNSNRWDIEMNNGILIKLPSKKVDEALKLVQIFLSEENLKNIKIIDARIKNQVIINEQ